jgi:hypothetical protein
MGLNAQTVVPVFASGQVLTAEQQNQINTGIPVFATTTTRDAAFGGTGEKTLAQGQYAYIEATSTLQVYTGSAWINATGAFNFITGAAFTTATSFSLPANTFSSTYRNYKLFVSITGVTADADFTMRLRAGGTDTTGGLYNSTLNGLLSTGAASNITTNADTSFNAGECDSAIAGYSLTLDIMSPNIVTYTTMAGTMTTINKAATASLSRAGGFWINSTTAFDSLTFISSVASSITGVYRVYGYSES